MMYRPINESWRTKQKGFYIAKDDRMGFGCNFEGNIFNVENFSTTTRTVFPTLQLYAGDNEAHSTPLFLAPGTPTSFGTGLRDVFMQSLASKYNLNVSPLHVKPVVAFINGRYWGVFTLKEVYDKYYEDYYNHQSKDSLDLAYYYNTEGYVSYDDGSVSKFLPATSFKTGVYDVVMNKPMNGPFYKTVTNALDTLSMIDYMATNTYALNSDLWKYNIAYAKGGRPSAPGNKWHYYLWNMPTIFNFTAVPVNTSFSYSNPSFSTCVLFSTDYVVSPSFAGNGTGAMMRKLMTPPLGSGSFQTAYKNRYQDLMNTAFKCENVLKHFDFVYNLYQKEMRYHEDPASLGGFYTAVDIWDTSMVHLRNLIDQRCKYVGNSFGARGSGGLSCFGLQGPYDLTINVEPAGAGSVRLNTILLDSYPWTGNYYQESQMLLKAIPTNTTFSFDHWEITTNHVLNNAPLSLDSIAISFITPDQITAVFTDKTRDLQSGVNVPTGFTPNGDNNNDYFKPVGSGKFESDYEMTVWNRWGQEVYRGTSPVDGWDGYYKGQQAPTGVYAYIIKYKNIFGEEKMLKGNVTLTR